MRNPELDRLKSEEQSLFKQKQIAFEKLTKIQIDLKSANAILQSAWNDRNSARETMNREFEARKSAFERRNSVWNEYGRIRDRNNSRIELLKREADSEHRSMQDCFNRASNAYQYGNKADAPMWSQQGHDHKARRDELNAEISMLGNEVKQAKYSAEANSSSVDSYAFNSAKSAYEVAKSRHESAQAEFNRLKSLRDSARLEFNQLHEKFKKVQSEFRLKLESVKSKDKKERERILDKAGVRYGDRSDAKIVKKSDGTIQVYHGGLGKGDGFGHGHASIDRSGNKTYDRKAFEKHGSQNFADSGLKNGTYSGEFNGHSAVVKISDAGNSDQMQVFYGGKGSPDGPGHNHLNYVNGKLQFWREDGKVIYRDDKKSQINKI